jgi:hypothetical protein
MHSVTLKTGCMLFFSLSMKISGTSENSVDLFCNCFNIGNIKQCFVYKTIATGGKLCHLYKWKI